MEESKRIADGLVFLPQQTVGEAEYRRLVQQHMAQITGSISTLTSLIPPISSTINNYNPSQEDLASLRQHVKEVLRIARALVKMQREGRSVVPPSDFSRAHELYIRIGPSFLEELWPLPRLIKNLVEGNASEAAHGLNLELAIPELNLLGEELNRIAQARTAGGGPKQSGGGAGCAAVGMLIFAGLLILLGASWTSQSGEAAFLGVVLILAGLIMVAGAIAAIWISTAGVRMKQVVSVSNTPTASNSKIESESVRSISSKTTKIVVGLAVAVFLGMFAIAFLRSSQQRRQRANEESQTLGRFEENLKQQEDQRRQDEQRRREEEAKQLRKDFPTLHLRHLEENRHNLAAVKQQMEEGKSQEQAEMNVHQANGACFVPPVGKITVDSLQRHEEAIEMCRKIREQNAAAWKN